MRILFVCHMLPHSLARDSGRLDTYYYIKALSHDHAVSVIAFVPEEELQAVAELESFCEHVTAVPYAHHKLIPRLQRAWGRFIYPKVYGRNQSPAYRRQLKTIVATQNIDVAIVHGMMANYQRYLLSIPAVLDEVDVFSMVAHHLFRQPNSPINRLWLGFDWLRTLVWEAHHLLHYNGVFVRSPKDQAIVQDLAPQQRVEVLPPWFEGLDELQAIPIERPQGNAVLFVGAMNIPANIEAVTFFASHVLPLLRSIIPDATLIIVGANPTIAVQNLATQPGVVVVGEVETLLPFYAQAAVIVAPLFIGGGIIVKTLNGLASGRPVVTTPVGNSGTGAENGRHLHVVPADPALMSTTIAHLLVNEQAWLAFATDGRQYIQTHYSWLQTTQNMTDFLHTIVKSPI